MKFHSKLMDVSKMGLVAALGLLATANVQAGDAEEAGLQVSMINQTSERAKANRVLKALEQEYVTMIIQALNRKSTGPDFSNEDIYVSHLVDVIDGKTQQGQPNYADEEVYVNYLVEILLK